MVYPVISFKGRNASVSVPNTYIPEKIRHKIGRKKALAMHPDGKRTLSKMGVRETLRLLRLGCS
jgi:hypothetical protein